MTQDLWFLQWWRSILWSCGLWLSWRGKQYVPLKPQGTIIKQNEVIPQKTTIQIPAQPRRLLSLPSSDGHLLIESNLYKMHIYLASPLIQPWITHSLFLHSSADHTHLTHYLNVLIFTSVQGMCIDELVRLQYWNTVGYAKRTMLQRTVFISKIRMLQWKQMLKRTRGNTIGWCRMHVLKKVQLSRV